MTPPNSGCGCPVDQGEETKADSGSLEEAAKHEQTPHPSQRVALSTHRVVSSIPRKAGSASGGGCPVDHSSTKKADSEEKPPHQPESSNNWVYPSEQQFYNALRRKGWIKDDKGNKKSAETAMAVELSMPDVIHIHNAVNERAWSQVRDWEKTLHGVENPRLAKFVGRPSTPSFKSLLNRFLFWSPAPFDRHDWYVDRGDGSNLRRYILDFYENPGKAELSHLFLPSSSSPQSASRAPIPSSFQLPQAPPSMHIDVRPAIDDFQSLRDRCLMFWLDAFPALSALIRSKMGNFRLSPSSTAPPSSAKESLSASSPASSSTHSSGGDTGN